MLTVLSANENLLERLALLIQNCPPPPPLATTESQQQQLIRAYPVLLSAGTNGLPLELPTAGKNKINSRMAPRPDGGAVEDTNNANAELLSESDVPEAPPFCLNWMVLMAKKSFNEHQITLQTLGDLLRLSLAMNGTMQSPLPPMMRILVVKKEHADEDEHCLWQQLELVKREWSDKWGAKAMDKIKRFGESAARQEQMERHKQWAAMVSEGMDRCGGGGGNGGENPLLPHCQCAMAYFDDLDLLTTINAFFQLGDGTCIVMNENNNNNNGHSGSGSGNQDKAEGTNAGGNEDGRWQQQLQQQQQLFTKPPALHWTNYPREAEVQVTLKFAFPKGTVPEWLFREWTSIGRHLLVWDYEYEWTNGIFLRADELVKVTITRAATEPNVIELSGRIDTDEAAEEEQMGLDEDDAADGDGDKKEEQAEEEAEKNFDGTEKEQAAGGDETIKTGMMSMPMRRPPTTQQRGASPPLQRVWPYLVRIFRQILADLDSRKTLPFNLSFVFIGDLFFIAPKDASTKISARSLDAIQTLSSIERIKVVRFRADQEQIYALNLEQCFPNFCPSRLTDFCLEHKFQLPARAPLSSSCETESSSIGGGGGGGGTTNTSPPSERAKVSIAMNEDAIITTTTTTPSILHSSGMEEESPPASDKVMEKVCVDRSPSCAPAFALLPNHPAAGAFEENRENDDNNNETKPAGGQNIGPTTTTTMASAQSLHVERQLGGYKNRGRRVSFGVIHSIPSPSDNMLASLSGRSSPGGGVGTTSGGGGSNSASPSPLLSGNITNRWFNSTNNNNDDNENNSPDQEQHRQQQQAIRMRETNTKETEEEENQNNAHHHPHGEERNCGGGEGTACWQTTNSIASPLAVENIVDEMLQKAMNEAIVRDRRIED